VGSTLDTIVILGTVLHFIVFGVMLWIRVHRWEDDGVTGPSPAVTPCARCGEPSTHRSYDGLDPNEQRDPHSGMAWSPDIAHYQPLCAAH
jgi:hypothetical protein